MLVTPLEGYRIWAGTYDSTPNPPLALERRAMQGVLRNVSGQRIIDVACGTGYWTRTLRQAGAIVFGFDNCPEMIDQAKRGHYFVADAMAIAVRSETADLTLCSFAASYFPDLMRAMSEMARITRPGGRVILSDMHPAAMAAGWKRSFTCRGMSAATAATSRCATFKSQVYEIEHRQWSEDSFLDAGRAAGLEPQEHFDEVFAEPERALFAAAGREHVFESVKRVPAIRITPWIRL